MTWLIIISIIMIAVIVIGGVILAFMPRKEPIQIGKEELIGKVGTVRKVLDPTGEIFIEGETWRAHSRAGDIKKGENVKVKDLKGLTLIVEKTDEEVY